MHEKKTRIVLRHACTLKNYAASGDGERTVHVPPGTYDVEYKRLPYVGTDIVVLKRALPGLPLAEFLERTARSPDDPEYIEIVSGDEGPDRP
ncbi:MAG: hypothetical protein AAB554_02720 [Patescibacteria group bacterium]